MNAHVFHHPKTFPPRSWSNKWLGTWVGFFLTEASKTKIGGKPHRVPPENFEKFVAEVHWKALTNCLIFYWFFSFPTSNEVLINLREISLAKPKTVESCGLRDFCGKGLLLVFFCIFCFFWGAKETWNTFSRWALKKSTWKKHLPRFSRKGLCWFQSLKSLQMQQKHRLLNSRKNQTPRFGEAIFSSGFNQPVLKRICSSVKLDHEYHDFSRIEVTIKNLWDRTFGRKKEPCRNFPAKRPSPSSMRGLVLLMDLAVPSFHDHGPAARFLSGQTDFTGQNVELVLTNTWKTSCSRWFKPWPFYPLFGGHQQSLKGSLNYPKKGTNNCQAVNFHQLETPKNQPRLP